MEARHVLDVYLFIVERANVATHFVVQTTSNVHTWNVQSAVCVFRSRLGTERFLSTLARLFRFAATKAQRHEQYTTGERAYAELNWTMRINVAWPPGKVLQCAVDL